MSCDNESTVFLDGRRLASCADHGKLVIVDLDWLEPGDHVVAVHARNLGGPAALALWLTWQGANGGRGQVVTDKSWRVGETAAPGWSSAGFDDAHWKAAAEHGATPGGGNVYGGKPDVVRASRYEEPAQAIACAVQTLRTAHDPAVALQALDAIERAVMAARRAAWAQHAASKPAK
jgi:hypothetical protein